MDVSLVIGGLRGQGFALGGMVSMAASMPLAAGAASITNSSATTVSVRCTPATGGDPPYSYQWQQSTDGVTFANSSGTDITTLTATVTGLTTNTLYYFRLKVTDSALDTAFSNVVNTTPSSTGGGGNGSLTEQQLVALAMKQRPYRKIRDGPTVPGFRARQRAKGK